MALGHKFEEKDLDCPFCSDGDITVHEHKPKKWGANDAHTYGIEVQVDECPACGKDRSELEKKLEKKGYLIK